MSNNQQRITAFVDRLRFLKSEMHQAVNPISLRDRVVELIESLEWIFGGQISNAQPNVVPGVPVTALDDPGKTKVEFTSGPGAVMAAQQAIAAHQAAYYQHQPPAPAAAPVPIDAPWAPRAIAPVAPPPGRPVNSGDVHFIPGPPPGVSTGGQVAVYFKDGVQVDVNGNPIAGAPPMPPPGPPPAAGPTPDQFKIPGGDYGGGQRVEFTGPGAPAPFAPGTPVSNQPAQLVQTIPTIPTEAGHTVAPVPGGGMNGMPLGPQNVEEARRQIPIPLAE